MTTTLCAVTVGAKIGTLVSCVSAVFAVPITVFAIKEAGAGLLLGGIIVTLTPQVVGLLFGHFVLRMKPILLLGALAGSQTVTAAMAAIQERSESPVAVLGYTPSYAVANILLTIWGVRFWMRRGYAHHWA